MVWWESSMGDTTYNDTPIVTIIARCPVCKTSLGRREKDEAAAFHCEECKALFTWFPGIDKPVARLDTDIAAHCKCFGCRFRRGEVEEPEPPMQYGTDCDD